LVSTRRSSYGAQSCGSSGGVEKPWNSENSWGLRSGGVGQISDLGQLEGESALAACALLAVNSASNLTCLGYFSCFDIEVEDMLRDWHRKHLYSPPPSGDSGAT
jgi:hypothetical protein